MHNFKYLSENTKRIRYVIKYRNYIPLNKFLLLNEFISVTIECLLIGLIFTLIIL